MGERRGPRRPCLVQAVDKAAIGAVHRGEAGGAGRAVEQGHARLHGVHLRGRVWEGGGPVSRAERSREQSRAGKRALQAVPQSAPPAQRFRLARSRMTACCSPPHTRPRRTRCRWRPTAPTSAAGGQCAGRAAGEQAAGEHVPGGCSRAAPHVHAALGRQLGRGHASRAEAARPRAGDRRAICAPGGSSGRGRCRCSRGGPGRGRSTGTSSRWAGCCRGRVAGRAGRLTR